MLVFVVFDPECNSGQGQNEVVHPSLLLEANVNPATTPSFGGPFQSNPFPKLTFFVRPEMVHGLDGIHEAYVIKVRMHFEEVFSEVLRSFKILKVSGNVVRWDKFFTLLGVPLIL